MNRIPRSPLALALALAACVHAAPRPAESIITDRPDVTESPFVVPAGWMQLESGYSSERAGAQRDQTFGEGLLRVSLDARTELRLGLNSYALGSGDAAHVGGFQDQSVGVKVKLLTPHPAARRVVPRVALIAATTLPGRRGPFREGTLQPEATLAAAWSLLPRLELAANALVSSATAGGARFATWGGSATTGLALTERLGWYGEYYGFTGAPHELPAHWLDAGITYQLTPDLQLDLRAGRRVGRRTFERTWGAGMATRW